MPKTRSRRIVVFGDVVDDVVIIPNQPMRSDSDTASMIRFRPGGSAANTAAWLGSIHAEVDFVGRVAALDHERHVRFLRDSGVHPILVKDRELPTGTVVMIVDGYRRTMLTDRGANTNLRTEAVTDALLNRARYLHLTGYSLLEESNSAEFPALIARAKAAGVDVSVNPASAALLLEYGKDRFLEAIAGAAILMLTEEDARVLTGLDDAQSMALALGQLFPIVAVMLGPNGALVAKGNDPVVRFPAIAVEVADTTGAEDAFCAGFLHSLLADELNAAAATEAGVALGGRAVGLIGGRPPA